MGSLWALLARFLALPAPSGVAGASCSESWNGKPQRNLVPQRQLRLERMRLVSAVLATPPPVANVGECLS